MAVLNLKETAPWRFELKEHGQGGSVGLNWGDSFNISKTEVRQGVAALPRDTHQSSLASQGERKSLARAGRAHELQVSAWCRDLVRTLGDNRTRESQLGGL